MKKIIALLLVLFVLVGCGGGSTGTDGSDDAAKSVTVQVPADVMSMDPQWATDGQSFSAQNMCFSGLAQLDTDGNPVPDLATWEISDDGTVYTFHLVDSYWSNGEKVTADDFVFGWQRLVSPELASDYNWLLETANVVNSGCYDPESGLKPEDLGIVALDEKTLQVTLTQPTGFFLQIVTFPSTFPLNRAFYESVGDQYALSLDNLLFCGPYKMVSWDSGYGYSFELNDKYYDYANYVGKYADVVNFRVVSDTQSALMEYESNGLDVVNLSGSQVRANADVEGFTERLGSYSFYLLLNVGYSNKGLGNPDLANLNVRKALSFGIDREDICNAINDGSIADAGLIPVSLAANPETGADFRDDAGTICSFDLEAAKSYYQAAVAELGHDVSLSLLYSSDQGDPEIVTATRIQAQLEEVGFTVTLNPQPKKTRLNVYQHVNDAAGPREERNADFEVSLTRWGPDYGDPQTYLDLFISANTSNNQGGYKSDKYDELVAKAEAAGTSAIDRWNYFVEAEKVLVSEDYGIVPVFQNGGACLINPSVSGIEFHSASVDVYRHMMVK